MVKIIMWNVYLKVINHHQDKRSSNTFCTEFFLGRGKGGIRRDGVHVCNRSLVYIYNIKIMARTYKIG